jgi:hypothetical protein
LTGKSTISGAATCGRSVLDDISRKAEAYRERKKKNEGEAYTEKERKRNTNCVSYVISLEINGILFALAYFAIKCDNIVMHSLAEQ